MNNVITIFIDSVTWEAVGTTRSAVSPTPFLDSLKEESVTANKLYSHGPYTDAAKTSLLTGRNCLDDFGYYYRENSSPSSDLKLFHDNGYETYCFHYPFWIYGNRMHRYIDHIVYTAGFVFGSEWGGMFGHYVDVASHRPLSDEETELLSVRFRLFFEAYINYVEDIINKGESSLLHGSNIDKNSYLDARQILLTEFEKFTNDSRQFIKDFTTLGMNHPIAKLKLWDVNDIVNKQFLDETYQENRSFFKDISKKNRRANFFSTFPSLKHLIWGVKRFLQTKDQKHLYFLINYKLLLRPFKEMTNAWGKPKWQVSNSIHSILQKGIEVLRTRDIAETKPFYMYLNTDDPHQNIAMFAYDTQDKSVVNSEIKALKEYVNEVDTKFRGSLLYFLSLRYVDYEIEKFCSELKAMKLWDNTTLLVLTDHGSSFTYYPLHNARVNCFYDECYHIPVLLRSPGLEGKVVETYQTSKDILPTVCDIVGLKHLSGFNGHSMLNPNRPQLPYVMTEYMGPGCPDMTTKRMWLSIRDCSFLIGYKVGVFEDFEDGELAEVYDLKKDPSAFYNINTHIDRTRINYLLLPLKDRFEQIKIDTQKFVDRLKEGTIVDLS